MIYLKLRIVNWMRPLEMKIHREGINKEFGINKRRISFGKRIRKMWRQEMIRERKLIKNGRKKLD